MDRDNLITILKGMWIGGTMTVPGVSGGSLAMILGVYDRLISSVSSFFRNPGKSMSFLVRSPPGQMCPSASSSWVQWPGVCP